MPVIRPFPRLLGLSLAVTAAITLLLIIFAWPNVRAAPNHLPVGLVAPAPVAQRLQQQLEQARPGGFDLHSYATEEEAKQAIRGREVYGAFVITASGPQVLTASAASPLVAQLLTQVAASLNPVKVNPVRAAGVVTDVVPATSADARQAGLGAVALPLVFGGMLSGLLLTRLFRRGRERVPGALLVAVFAGLSLTGILQGWFGTLQGNYWTNSLVVALGVGATVAFVLGLEANLGAAGLGLAAAVNLLLGNPFSALGSAPELYPGVWGAFGQLLIPGAFGNLLRSVAFFGGAHSSAPLLVLSAWVTAGLGSVLIGSRRRVNVPVSSLVSG